MTATTATRVFTDAERAVLDRVRETVRAIEPDATVILYGSRARGDHEPDSDWDILVLLNGDVDHERVRSVRYRVYDVERETNSVLSTVVRSRQAWVNPQFGAVPFRQNVAREGISL